MSPEVVYGQFVVFQTDYDEIEQKICCGIIFVTSS